MTTRRNLIGGLSLLPLAFAGRTAFAAICLNRRVETAPRAPPDVVGTIPKAGSIDHRPATNAALGP